MRLRAETHEVKSVDAPTRLDFDRRLLVQFRGSVVTSEAELLVYRELDDALGLSAMAGDVLADRRTGKNDRPALVGLLRQSVFGRLADTRMSTMPNGCAMIRRCVGSSSARRPAACLGRRSVVAGQAEPGQTRGRTMLIRRISDEHPTTLGSRVST